MDLTILFVGILSSSTIILVLSIFGYIFPGASSHNQRSNSALKTHHEQLPPGRMGLPLVGESLEFLSCVAKGEAEKFVFNRVCKYSSRVFKTNVLGEDVIVMHGAAENKFLFVNTNNLVAEWWPKHVGKLIGLGKNTHLRLRDLLQPLVTSSALRRYVQVMDSMIKGYLQANWRGKQKVLALPSIKFCNLASASRIFLSIEDDDDLISKFMDPTQAVASGFAALPLNLPWTTFGKALNASKEFKRMLSPVIKERKANLSLNDSKQLINPDLITSALISSTDKHGNQIMTEEEIADKVIEILVGVHESSGMISLIFNHLADHPDVYSRVLHEQMEVESSKAPGELLTMDDIHKLKYLSAVTREVMRIHAPAVFAFRQVISDFTYNGFRIPKGWKILLNISAIHKDPEYFPNPEKFDPSRFERDGPMAYTYMPFGGGSLLCPGKNFAQLFTSVFMYNVVKMFSWEKLISDEKVGHEPGPVPTQGLPLLLYAH